MLKQKLIFCLTTTSLLTVSTLAVPAAVAQAVRIGETREGPAGASETPTLSIATPNQITKAGSARGGRPAEQQSAAAHSIRPQEGKVETNEVVQGHSDWEKYYRNGCVALEERKFKHAEDMLLKAVHDAKSPGTTSTSLTDSRLALARLYLKQDRLPEAHDLYSMTLSKAHAAYGHNSPEVAECLIGLAYTEARFGHEKVAKENAETAISILRSLNKTDSQLYALSLHTLGLVMVNHGWYEDAKKYFEQSRDLLEKNPGYEQLDLADVLREQSLFYHSIGDKRSAYDLYEKSYRIIESAVAPNLPPSVAGQVRFVWEPGSTRAQEIIDSDFPFRYMSAHGVRVACTIIDVWELLAVIITVTNVGSKQEEMELGNVVVERVDRQNLMASARVIPPVDPNRIDRIGKERTMWDLTSTRPWLANIQKTRTVRGLVPPNGHDLFMGPNVFGVWGEWKAVSHTVPERVGVLPSREGLVANIDANTMDLPGLVRPGKAKLPGLIPVWLEPFESRTGELFYLYPRDCDINIKVPVGNAIFQFPFRTRKFKLPRSI